MKFILNFRESIAISIDWSFLTDITAADIRFLLFMSVVCSTLPESKDFLNAFATASCVRIVTDPAFGCVFSFHYWFECDIEFCIFNCVASLDQSFEFLSYFSSTSVCFFFRLNTLVDLSFFIRRDIFCYYIQSKKFVVNPQISLLNQSFLTLLFVPIQLYGRLHLISFWEIIWSFADIVPLQFFLNGY